MFGVSPRASCSCRPPLPISPTTTSPVWIPSRTARRTPYSCSRRVFNVPMASTIPSPLRTARWTVVFMGLGIAEVHQQAIAEVLGNVAVKALNDLGTGGLIGAHHLAQVFRIELARQHRRVHQVTEQHGELAAFGVRGRRRGRCGEARRGGASAVPGGASGWGAGGVVRGHVRTARPDQHCPLLIHGEPLALNEFGLQVLKIVVIQVELALEGAIRQAPAALQEGNRLIEESPQRSSLTLHRLRGLQDTGPAYGCLLSPFVL